MENGKNTLFSKQFIQENNLSDKSLNISCINYDAHYRPGLFFASPESDDNYHNEFYEIKFIILENEGIAIVFLSQKNLATFDEFHNACEIQAMAQSILNKLYLKHFKFNRSFNTAVSRKRNKTYIILNSIV